MSEGARALITTAIYNPALLRKEDLIRGFAARQDLLERLLDDLRRAEPGTPPQHHLLLGQRGFGKTTLLRRVAFAIEDDASLSAKWIPLVFPEEQRNIKTLGHFWLNCADALGDALERADQDLAAEALDAAVKHVPADPERRPAAALAALLDAVGRLGRGLVLLVDNLDRVLDPLSQAEEWELRRVISEEHRLYFVGASSRALEALYEHGRAFYDYFQVHDLKGLDDKETFALLETLAGEAGDERVRRLVRERPSRVRTARLLTGGNPRTLVLLYRVLAEGPDGDVQRDVEQLLDLYTPLYQDRCNGLALQLQQILDAMAIHWDPITAGALAGEMAPMSVNQVSAQLKRLEDLGLVEKTPRFGESRAAFQISERFFNIWYLMRASRRVRRRLLWLVRFLEGWFGREELSERARGYLAQDPERVGCERYAEMALAYSQAVEDRYPRRSLEDPGDFSDLPPELQDRKARMERLRDLRIRVLAMRFESVEAAEFWRLLGGSPHLSLEQKTTVVERLPSMDGNSMRRLFEELRSSENRLEAQYPVDLDAIARLYDALANGEMAGVYDLEAALAVAKRRGCPGLPSVAVASRVSRWISSAPAQDRELLLAEETLHKLTLEPGFESQAWNTLGNLLQERLGRADEAECAYRRAIELDRTLVYPWVGLGGLLRTRRERFDEAERAYKRAIELAPQLARPWNEIGNLLSSDLQRSEEAERAYRRAIHLDPQSAYPWMGLGNLLWSRAPCDAEQAFRRAVALDPQHPYAWAGLGGLLSVQLDRFGEAEQACRRATELDPLNATYWRNLGRLLEGNMRRQADALDAFARSLDIDADGRLGEQSSLLRLARSLAPGPHFLEALRAVTRAHELLPNHTGVQFTLAGLHALDGKWDETGGLLEKLARGESSPDYWAFRAIVTRGYVTDAVATLESAGADQRWRPLYEALRAIQAGSPDYLLRVAPEVRRVAEEILDEIAPDFRKKQASRPKSRGRRRS